MKLSVSWIFDHIDADWKDYSVKNIVEIFNKTTAEIEGFHHIVLNFDTMTLVTVKAIDQSSIKVFSEEHQKEYDLPFRSDCSVGACYMILISPQTMWARGSDFHSSKEGLLPALQCDDQLQDGSWKHAVDKEDYILEVDNKSITHRPDMWGHRGFAREIAAFLNLPLKALGMDYLDDCKRVTPFATHAPSTDQHPFDVKIEDTQIGKRFAGLYLPQVHNTPSALWMALRLLRVDSKPIDALVDITNYVMLDLSQPMHAFDAAYLPNHTIVARLARAGEKLVLLDGQEITLTPQDYVITDGTKPIALAGVMGGKESGISLKTTSLFLEAAAFDAGTIRKTSARYKTRTEASARFEKTLDPNQNIDAIRRFLKLCQDLGIKVTTSEQIVSLGTVAKSKVITLAHSFIEKRIGTTINRSFVLDIFKRLGFDVIFETINDHLEYQVTVPTYRCTKEITRKEDLVEEVARFYGYDNIPAVLPSQQRVLSDLSPVFRMRTIRRFFAQTWQAHEVYNYAFYDESLLAQLDFNPLNTPVVQSPVSENWRRLVTSLVPHLLKNIKDNCATHHSLRFFEWGRVWSQHNDQITEQKRLAAVIYEAKEPIDFYYAKSLVERFCEMIGLSVSYVSVAAPEQPWFTPYKTADLVHDGEIVGRIGQAHHLFAQKLFAGNAFIVELDGDFLLNYRHRIKTYQPLSKYPHVHRDVSIFVPLPVTVDTVRQAIKMVDPRIVETSLVDFFEKPEWEDKRSLTLRYVLEDKYKTLTTHEVDQVSDRVHQALKELGATIR